jgi:hypothetical protein
MGKAFGQILAYMSIISNNAEEFLKKIHDKTNWFTWDYVKEMLCVKRVPIKFYVAFRKENVKGNLEFMKWLENNVLSKKIGIILVENKKCEKVVEAERIDIIVKKRYNSFKEFFIELKERIQKEEEVIGKIKGFKIKGNHLKFYYVHSGLHFEIWLKKRKKEIETGLHLEANKKEAEEFLKS